MTAGPGEQPPRRPRPTPHRAGQDEQPQGVSFDKAPPPPGYLPPAYQQAGAYPPPGYYQPYPAWQWQPGYGPKPGTNGFAIASLVLSIVTVFGIGSVLGLIFGYIARRQCRETGQAGSGMALAGIIVGWCTLVLVIAYIVLIVLLVVFTHDSSCVDTATSSCD